MKSIKLLLLSSTLPLISVMFILPATAKSTITIHHIKISYTQIIPAKKALLFDTYFTGLSDAPVKKNVNNNLSTRLVLSSINKTAEQQQQKKHLNDVNNNSFYESAMIFNDKMQQVISYFKNHHTT